jgi:hypothetical protein
VQQAPRCGCDRIKNRSRDDSGERDLEDFWLSDQKKRRISGDLFLSKCQGQTVGSIATFFEKNIL